MHQVPNSRYKSILFIIIIIIIIILSVISLMVLPMVMVYISVLMPALHLVTATDTTIIHQTPKR